MNLRKILHFIWRDKFNENPLPVIDSYIKEHPEALQITSGANNVIYKERKDF